MFQELTVELLAIALVAGLGGAFGWLFHIRSRIDRLEVAVEIESKILATKEDFSDVRVGLANVEGALKEQAQVDKRLGASIDTVRDQIGDTVKGVRRIESILLREQS